MDFLTLLIVILAFVIGAPIVAYKGASFSLAVLMEYRPIFRVLFPIIGLLVVLLVGHWDYLVSVPEGLRSRDWPSTRATIVRVHTTYRGDKDGEYTRFGLDMPYVYSVNGKNYRGTRFNVTGNFIGIYPVIHEMTKDPGKTFTAFYNPNRPQESVLVPGMVTHRFNRRTILPVILLTLLLLYGIFQLHVAPEPVKARSSMFAHKILAALIGFTGLIWVAREALLYFDRSFPLHGVHGGYSILAEEPMNDGPEYWIAASHYWSPWRDEERGGPEWFLDVRDKQFIAADGTLKNISRRKWTIFQMPNHFKATDSPKNAEPDWIMTWTPETGIQTEANSQKAKIHLEEIQRNKEQAEQRRSFESGVLP